MRTGADKLPADSLVLSTKQIWEVIRSQKDLNLPAHKVGTASGLRLMINLAFVTFSIQLCNATVPASAESAPGYIAS